MILVLDYVRWTQFVPMLVAWAFILLGVGMMALVNFQETGFTVVEWLVATWERYPWLPRLGEAVDTTESGGLRLDGDGFREVVLAGWAGISAVLLVLSLARRALFGPADPMPFRRKLGWLVAALALIWLALAGIYLLGSETFHGPPWHWFLGFTLACGGLFVVSAYSLAWGHFLGWVQEGLRRASDENPGEAEGAPGPQPG